MIYQHIITYNTHIDEDIRYTDKTKAEDALLEIFPLGLTAATERIGDSLVVRKYLGTLVIERDCAEVEDWTSELERRAGLNNERRFYV